MVKMMSEINLELLAYLSAGLVSIPVAIVSYLVGRHNGVEATQREAQKRGLGRWQSLGDDTYFYWKGDEGYVPNEPDYDFSGVELRLATDYVADRANTEFYDLYGRLADVFGVDRKTVKMMLFRFMYSRADPENTFKGSIEEQCIHYLESAGWKRVIPKENDGQQD